MLSGPNHPLGDALSMLWACPRLPSLAGIAAVPERLQVADVAGRRFGCWASPQVVDQHDAVAGFAGAEVIQGFIHLR